MAAAMQRTTGLSDRDHTDKPGSRRGVLGLSNRECPVNRDHSKPGIGTRQVHRIGANGCTWARSRRMLNAVADARKNHADSRMQTKPVEQEAVHREFALREVVPLLIRLQAVVIHRREVDGTRTYWRAGSLRLHQEQGRDDGESDQKPESRGRHKMFTGPTKTP